MTRLLSRTVLVMAMVAVLPACTDKAEADYAACIQAEANGDVVSAAVSCEIAAGIDPDSAAGKAAIAKLSSLQPAVKEALQHKITRKYWSPQPNGLCTGRGLPPYRWTYEGGTFVEDTLAALADGCVKLTRVPEDMTFCCPREPVTF